MLIASVSSWAQSGKPLIRFGIISDIQYCDCDPNGSRIYRNSLQKLTNCVQELNGEKLAFTLNLGDIVDRDAERSLEPVLQILSKSKSPVYNLPGNHDYDGVKDNSWLYQKLGMPGAYYSIKKKKWRFIMLNSNEVASYANIDNTPKATELKEMLDVIKMNQMKNGAPYNGGVGKEQLAWLENELKDAQKRKESVIVFSHHPFGCAESLAALDAKTVTALLKQYQNVKALIAGHHHAGAACEVDGITCIVTEGMVETEDTNAFGVVEIYKDRILLNGKGRTRSHQIPL